MGLIWLIWLHTWAWVSFPNVLDSVLIFVRGEDSLVPGQHFKGEAMGLGVAVGGGPETVPLSLWIQNSAYDENEGHLLLPCIDIGNNGVKPTVKKQCINTNQDSGMKWNYLSCAFYSNILEVKTKGKPVPLKNISEERENTINFVKYQLLTIYLFNIPPQNENYTQSTSALN